MQQFSKILMLGLVLLTGLPSIRAQVGLQVTADRASLLLPDVSSSAALTLTTATFQSQSESQKSLPKLSTFFHRDGPINSRFAAPRTDLAFFCRLELKLEDATRLPVRFRLGSTQYVDYLEGKFEGWRYGY